MTNKYVCGLDALFSVFEQDISAADIIASKSLSKISATIVKQRISLGMTQKEFADYMGVSQGMVSKWESEDYNFTIKSLAEIAVKLNLDVDINLSFPMTNREKEVLFQTASLAYSSGACNSWMNPENKEIMSKGYTNMVYNEGGRKWSNM